MNEQDRYHVHIEAGASPLSLNLKEVWKYRDLVVLLTKRNFSLIYKQTVLGPLWVVLNPLLTSIVYTVVFGEMAGLSTGGVPKILFYLCSHALWRFFADCLNRNTETFISNARVFGKVYFPRLTVPLSTMLYSGIRFLVEMGLVAVLILWFLFRGEVRPAWALLPVLLPVVAVTGLLGLSMGILISSVTTRYRDLRLLVSFGMQLWMYASPVIYPVSQISGGLWRTVLELNPMTAPMEIFRLCVLGSGTVTVRSVISTVVSFFVIVPVSMMLFNRVERNFIDTV